MTMAKYLVAAIWMFVFVQSAEQPPTWKGYVCMGWAKPEAESIVQGESTGEELVVNTDLTAAEKQRLENLRKITDAAYKAEIDLEHEILKNHGYSIERGAEFGAGPCGEFIGIRSGEYHITQFVPSNPSYPGDAAENFAMMIKIEKLNTPSECRAYFSKLRKQAVKATYGNSR